MTRALDVQSLYFLLSAPSQTQGAIHMAYNKALVAYDGSEHGKQALAAAFELVDHSMVKKLVILHVVTTHRGVEPMLEAGSMFASSDTEAFETDERSEVVREIERLIVDYRSITEISIRVGTPRIEIIHTVDTRNCDLIIMGSRGLGTVRSMLGSVSSSVLAESEVPVFILR